MTWTRRTESGGAMEGVVGEVGEEGREPDRGHFEVIVKRL